MQPVRRGNRPAVTSNSHASSRMTTNGGGETIDSGSRTFDGGRLVAQD
jgi:hypothetical protein